MIVHAGLIALYVRGRWRGALIEGESGAGKSDLALRALTLGFRLAADDRVRLWTSQGRLWGCAPDTLHGLVEVRGQPIARTAALAFCEVALIACCGAPDRAPDPATVVRLGVETPMITLAALEASAPHKLRLALERAPQAST